jgi:hypothetical protein
LLASLLIPRASAGGEKDRRRPEVPEVTTVDVSQKDLAEVDRVLEFLKQSCGAQLSAVRVGNNVLVAGGEAQRALAVKALEAVRAGQGQAVVDSIDVAKYDPTCVDALIAWFKDMAERKGTKGPLALTRTGKTLVVWGLPDDIKAVKDQVALLRQAEPPPQRVATLYIRGTADPDEVGRYLEARFHAWTWTLTDRKIQLYGTDANIDQRKLAMEQALVEGNYFYSPPQAATSEADDSPEPTTVSVRLYFIRNAAEVALMLNCARRGCGAWDVSVLPNLSRGALPSVILSGPRLQIRRIKQVLAQIDVPHSDVRLDVWACQISGSEPQEVARRAAQARNDVEAVARLVRGYLQVLEASAQDIQAEDARASSRLQPDGGAKFSVAAGDRLLLTPTAGPHPLSLTEMLVMQIMRSSAPELRASVREDLRQRLAAWCEGLRADGTELKIWAGALRSLTTATDDSPRAAQLLTWLQGGPGAPAGKPPKGGAPKPLPAHLGDVPDALLPLRFLDVIAGASEKGAAQQCLGNFFLSPLGAGNDSEDPDRANALRSDAQAILQRAEWGLSRDVHALFLEPLEEELRGIVSRRNVGGLGSVSTTSLAVISEQQAHVVGSAMSYYDVTQPPRLTQEAVEKARNLGQVLHKTFEPQEKSWLRADLKSDAASWATRLSGSLPNLQAWALPAQPTTSGTTPAATSLMLVGDRSSVDAAMDILRGAGAVQSAGSAQPVSTEDAAVAASRSSGGAGRPISASLPNALEATPAEQLATLALTLSDQPRVWSAMREGTELTFTPHVLRGGNAAELEVHVSVSHEDPSDRDTRAAPTTVPLSRVACHEAQCTVYLQPLDLFSLSTFSMRTTFPSPRGFIPVLAQLPLIGNLFTYPRAPGTVHHESLLVVNSTILSTPDDLREVLTATVLHP